MAKCRTEKENCWQLLLQYRKAGFPNVIGCIDGTQIRIQAPTTDEVSYVNRKGYHSISVQAVCDDEGMFTSINASWPGSCHDSHVFRTSGLCRKLETENRTFGDGVLLGDSGYISLANIIVICSILLIQILEKYKNEMNAVLVLISLIGISAAQRTVEEKVRLLEPLLMLADELLENQDDNQCVEKLFCLLETEIARDIDNPLKHVSRFLTNTRNDTDPSDFLQIDVLIKKYPRVSQMLDSIHLGQSSGQSSVCSAAFSICEADPSAMIEAAKKYDDTSVSQFTQHMFQRRKVCTYIKAGCTGLKIGCGICAIFTFGSCGIACGGLVSAACTASKLTCTAVSIIG